MHETSLTRCSRARSLLDRHKVISDIILLSRLSLSGFGYLFPTLVPRSDGYSLVYFWLWMPYQSINVEAQAVPASPVRQFANDAPRTQTLARWLEACTAVWSRSYAHLTFRWLTCVRHRCIARFPFPASYREVHNSRF